MKLCHLFVFAFLVLSGGSLFAQHGTLEFTAPVFQTVEPVYTGTVASQTKTVTITVARTGGTVGEVSVPYSTTAIESLSFAGEDYGSVWREYYGQSPEVSNTSETNPSGFLTWADGEGGEKSFSFEIKSDSTWSNFVPTANPLVEGVESLFLFLGSPRGGATLGENHRARFDILDAEAPAGGQGVIQFERPRFSAMENASTMQVVLRRVQGTAGSVSARISTVAGVYQGFWGVNSPITPAVAGADYTAVSQVVTWADGDSADKIVTIPLIDNTAVQSATDSRGVKGIRLQLSEPTGGAAVSVNSALGLIIDDESEIFDVWTENQSGKRMSIRLPRNTENIRGLIHFMPGTGGDWRYQVGVPSNQAVADQWGFAISGQYANAFATTYPSGIAKFRNHLDAFALFTGRLELHNVPVIFTGISAGGFACLASHGSVPEQVLGFVAHKGGSYEFNKGLSQYDNKPYIHESNLFTPGLIIAGSNDGTVEAQDLYDPFLLYRQSLAPGSQFTTAIDWNIGHSDTGGQGWAMAYLFMDELIRMRYPVGQLPGTTLGAIVDLINIPHEDTWLVQQSNAFLLNRRSDPALAPRNLQIRPAAGVADPGTDGIVISERLARAYQAFSSLHATSYQGSVPFQSPLKITSQTTTHNTITSVNEGSQSTFTLDPRGYSNFNRADFYFNNQLVGTRTSAPWSVTFTPAQTGVGLLRVETSTDGAGEIRYAFETILVRTVPPVAPFAPTDLSVVRADDVTANLTWTVPEFATSILVQRSMSGAIGPWETIATLGGSANNYTDTTLAAGASFWYRIVASNAYGNSPASSIGITLIANTESLVNDPFTDGGITNGADALDVPWALSDSNNATFTVVQDSALDPDAPNNVAQLAIAATNTERYLAFPLPSEVSLAVDEGLRVSFRLRHTGTPRSDAASTGVSLAHTPSNSPWNNVNNREYFFKTSFGSDTNLADIRKTGTGGAQVLNTGTQTLASSLPAINAGTDPLVVQLEVYRLGESSMRVRYQLGNNAPQEVVDTSDVVTSFNRVYFRLRTRPDAPDPAFRLDDVRVDKLTPATLAVPGNVEGLTVAPVSQTSLQITWTPASQAAGHRIERSPTGLEGSWTTLDGSLLGNAASFTDTGLTMDTTYHYRVQAFNDIGSSVWVTASGTTQGAVAFELVLPANVAEDAGSFQANVTRTVTSGSQIVLLSTSSARLSVPASVTFAAGQSSVSFQVSVLDQAGVQATELATINAFAPAAVVGESFTGPVDEAVNTQDTGWGWGGAWYNGSAVSATLVEPSLTYTQNGSILSSGTRSARLVQNAEGGSDMRRNFPSKLSTGDVWVSTLLYRNSNNWGTQLIIRENTGGGNWARVRYNSNTDHWILEAGTGNLVQLLNSNPYPTTFFVVMQFDFTARKIRAWLSPDVSGVSPVNALGTGEVDMQETLTGISRLDFSGWSNLDEFDEIRVADSFANLYGGTTFTGQVEITDSDAVSTAFEIWQGANFTAEQLANPSLESSVWGVNADPDGDGVPNLLEYALGGDPLATNLAILPSVAVSGSQLSLSFTPATLEGLTFVIEASNDLINWSAQTNITANLTASQPYSYQDNVVLEANSRRFLRLRVTY